jgi:hypothetical protein
MITPLRSMVWSLLAEAFLGAWNTWFPISIPLPLPATKKPGLQRETGLRLKA